MYVVVFETVDKVKTLDPVHPVEKTCNNDYFFVVEADRLDIAVMRAELMLPVEAEIRTVGIHPLESVLAADPTFEPFSVVKQGFMDYCKFARRKGFYGSEKFARNVNYFGQSLHALRQYYNENGLSENCKIGLT